MMTDFLMEEEQSHLHLPPLDVVRAQPHPCQPSEARQRQTSERAPASLSTLSTLPHHARMDRQERRQQRMRGAGASTVQENFGFSFAGLAPKPKPQTPAKQAAPLPPRQSSHRSSSAPRHATPHQRTVTPKMGKRKRPSLSNVAPVQVDVDDGEPDDLSPDRNDHVHSVEKSRRVVGTVSPLRDPLDEEPDELSIMEDGPSTAKRISPAAVKERTPIANRTSNMVSRRTVSLNTPSLQPARQRTSSASHFGPEFTTPGAAPHGDDSEDELSTSMIASFARVVAPTPRTVPPVEDEDEVEPDQDVDELSSPQAPLSKRTPAPASVQTRRPRRSSPGAEATVHATPTVTKPRQKQAALVSSTQPETEEDAPDELSPEIVHTRRHPQKVARHEEELSEVASADESDHYEPEVEEQSSAPEQRPAKVSKPTSGDPPRKRQKFGGPKRPISVMRIKGSTVRGVTVADTTRTMLEQTIDHRVRRMAEKLQRAQESSRRKQIRNEINLVLAFKESLNEKLLDLQDANDTLSAGFQKRKLFKSKNVGRRKKILALQNSRQEIALELDNEQADFEADKEKKEAETRLSTNMFDIQAAIQSGRDRARQLGRENEGPNVPLSMLLESVGRSVGSIGGGLLAGVREFNSGLERAAGWLEGRA
jgi:hypothetical protein